MQKFGNLYIDTNIIFSFNFNIHNDPKWQNLKKRTVPLKIKAFIPQIAVEELLILRKEEFNKKLREFRILLSDINRKITSKLKVQDYSDKKLEKELEQNIYENLKRAEIEIFDTPFDKIDLKKLANMAINKIPPFKEKDKGFKDTLILLSIIEHSKSIEAEEYFFLTNNKKDFDSNAVKDLIEKNCVKIRIFFSIEDLEKYLDNFINEKDKESIRHRNENLKKFLLSNKEAIQNFIDNYPFNEFYLKKGTSLLIERIERIEKIELLDNIQNSTVGFLKKGRKKGDVEIEFEIKANFYVIIERLITKKEERVFKVGAPSLKITVPMPERDSMKIEKLLKIRGEVHIEIKNSKEYFSKLRLHTIEEEEFSNLARVLLSKNQKTQY